MRHVTAEFVDYLEGTLSEARRRQVEMHLEHCPECARRLDMVQDALQRLQQLSGPELPATFAADVYARLQAKEARPVLRWGLRPLLAGGIAVIVLMLITGFFLFCRLRPTQPDSIPIGLPTLVAVWRPTAPPYDESLRGRADDQEQHPTTSSISEILRADARDQGQRLDDNFRAGIPGIVFTLDPQGVKSLVEKLETAVKADPAWEQLRPNRAAVLPFSIPGCRLPAAPKALADWLSSELRDRGWLIAPPDQTGKRAPLEVTGLLVNGRDTVSLTLSLRDTAHRRVLRVQEDLMRQPTGNRVLADPHTRDALLAEMRGADRGNAEEAAVALAHAGLSAQPDLVKMLQDKHAFARRLAAWALGRQRNRNAIPPLIETLGDADAGVQEMAILALTRITGLQLGRQPARWEHWWRQQQAASTETAR